MADSAAVRITGPVIGLDVREGLTRGEAPRPYRMVTAKVLVGEGIAECTIPDKFPEPTKGEFVDWLADVSMDISQRFGASLRVRVRGVFEDVNAPGAFASSL